MVETNAVSADFRNTTRSRKRTPIGSPSMRATSSMRTIGSPHST